MPFDAYTLTSIDRKRSKEAHHGNGVLLLPGLEADKVPMVLDIVRAVIDGPFVFRQGVLPVELPADAEGHALGVWRYAALHHQLAAALLLPAAEGEQLVQQYGDPGIVPA